MENNLYAIFYTYCEDEGNIVSEFLGISDSVCNGNKIIKDNLSLIGPDNNIKPGHHLMTKDNNYTYLGNKNNVININARFRNFTGFVIQPIHINESLELN